MMSKRDFHTAENIFSTIIYLSCLEARSPNIWIANVSGHMVVTGIILYDDFCVFGSTAEVLQDVFDIHMINLPFDSSHSTVISFLLQDTFTNVRMYTLDSHYTRFHTYIIFNTLICVYSQKYLQTS